MSELISHKILRASKQYLCDGGQIILETGTLDEINSELDDDEKIEKCNNIQKGEKYIRQFARDGGDTWEFKCCLDCYQLMNENDLFE